MNTMDQLLSDGFMVCKSDFDEHGEPILKIISCKKTIYELICRACGNTMKRTMTQFDSLPNCSKCGSEMLVENVTTEKEKTMATRKKFEPKIIKRITLPVLRLVADTPVYVKIISAIVQPKKEAGGKKGRGQAGFFKVVNLETDDEMHFVPGAKVQSDILANYPNGAYVDKCFSVTKVKTAGQDGGRGYSSYDISEIAAASQ